MQAGWNVVQRSHNGCFSLQRKRRDSSDAGVAGLTMQDGQTLVKLALQVETRRPRR